MKNYKIKVPDVGVSLLLAISALPVLGINQQTAFAEDYQYSAEEYMEIIDMRLQNADVPEEDYGLYEIATIHNVFNMNVFGTVDKIKHIRDFCDNEYTLFECAPTGYIILHNQSYRFVEYSASALSPYIEYDEEESLLYAGPMEYYINDYGILDETTLSSEDESSLSDASSEINGQLVEEPNDEVKEFVESGGLENNDDADYIKEVFQVQEEEPEYQESGNGGEPITMEDFFLGLKTRDEVGYYDEYPIGFCGFVAANMVIAYNYFRYDKRLIDPVYVDEAKHTLNGNGLTQELINIAVDRFLFTKGLFTTASWQSMYVNSYLNDLNLDSQWSASFSSGAISVEKSIKNGNPVALFGHIPEDSSKSNKCWHAVVAYGTARYGLIKIKRKYRIHFGWGEKII